jgi:gluconolactonase
MSGLPPPIDYVVVGPAFEAMIDRRRAVVEIDASSVFTEGPVWFHDGQYLVWSDIPGNRMLSWRPGGGVTVFRADSCEANGNTRDRQGRLLTCEHLTRRLTRLEPDGSTTVLAERFEGKRLNSPNDVVVKSDDTIWFTDPSYGLFNRPHAVQELAHESVYRLDPKTGGLRPVVSDFKKPNGLAFSPDEALLYIADSSREHDPNGVAHLRRFTVRDDGTLSGGEIFVTTEGTPDGLRVDAAGNIWTSAGPKVDVYAPDATLLGRITGFPANVSNLTFGGVDRDLLFVTSAGSLYAVPVGMEGAQWP